MLKPFLKWAGGKRQLLSEIRPRIPSSMDCYYEPFVGAGAVFLDLMPQKARINDGNCQLIESYRAIQACPDDLIAALQQHILRHSKEYYYAIRDLDRQPGFEDIPLAERAARLIYLNKTCFNGLYRVNIKGQFNVPFGRQKAPKICEEPLIRSISTYLNEADIAITCGDFENEAKDATRDSFVYFDPPYYCEGGESFTGYQAGGFGRDEHKRLHAFFAWLSERGVRCMLSNSDEPWIRELYADFTIETVQAIRPINSDVKKRGKVNELLIRNYVCDDA